MSVLKIILLTLMKCVTFFIPFDKELCWILALFPQNENGKWFRLWSNKNKKMKLMCYIPSFLKPYNSLLDERTIIDLLTSNFPLCHSMFVNNDSGTLLWNFNGVFCGKHYPFLLKCLLHIIKEMIQLGTAWGRVNNHSLCLSNQL